ncbi:Transcription initiation factor TFIID subunit 10 [Holothuria leucospilota]|uniref:Transcription initiation factor TFIID subunit 10 n=1 Tax=Holothuria leucospilota TaxID=206669 RepID=A0A9Q0YJ11_HOLLE|nr:Transcription initiation factor TFIID subunit 10 [Holothuria leucospilota]
MENKPPIENGSESQSSPTTALVSQNSTNSNSSSVSSENDERLNEAIQLAGDSLEDMLNHMADYAPTVPEAVTGYYLNRAGFETADPRLVRVISLAAQKFISDIANDALQHCKMKGSVQTSRRPGKQDKRYTLTMEDLSAALSDHGINVKKPVYFT